MEVEVQHAEYGGNGWLHFLITNFIVSPSSRGEFLITIKGCARHVFREYKMKKTLKEFRELNNDELKKLLQGNPNLNFEVPKTNCSIDITIRQNDPIDEFMDELIDGIRDLMDRVDKVRL